MAALPKSVHVNKQSMSSKKNGKLGKIPANMKSKKDGRYEYYDGKKSIFNLGFGDSFYIPNFIESKKEQKIIFAKLINEINFEQMFNFTHSNNKIKPIPRLVIAQTYKNNIDNSPIYRYFNCVGC